MIARVVALTNAERRKAGLTPVLADPSLGAAAQSYADVLARGSCWAHTCGPEPELVRRAVGAGYREWLRLAENLAAGVIAPEAAVEAWMRSEGHRANILDAAVSEVGVGMARGGALGTYWTQVFGSRRDSPGMERGRDLGGAQQAREELAPSDGAPEQLAGDPSGDPSDEWPGHPER